MSLLVTLKKNYEFANVFRHGKRRPGHYLSLHYRKNRLGYNRFGFTTVKHFGNAVHRNRMRRLLREAMRAYTDNLECGYDIIIMGRLLENPTSFHQIRAELLKLLTKEQLIKQTEELNNEKIAD